MEQAVKQINTVKKYSLVIMLAIFLYQFGVVQLSAAPKSKFRHPAEHYDMELKFDVINHTLTGKSAIAFTGKSKKEVGFILNNSFNVISASIGDIPLELSVMEDYKPKKTFPNYGRMGTINTEKVKLWHAEIPKQVRKKGTFVLNVEWDGELYVAPDNREFSRESIALEVSGTIGNEGIFLSPSAYWYPFVPESPATYRMQARLPLGWNGVTAGSPKWHDEGEYTVVEHISEQQIDGLNFSAGKYIVKSVDHNGVMVMTYMQAGQEDLADGYIESSIGYIDRYSEQIAPYPFPKFAVVDNFLPSGYGMPGWTLLGSEVIRLPFIRFTSLGHEVLHNWFGNSMWVDYRGGNWCEGLTTYLADYAYKNERDSLSGVSYRANALRDLASYVNDENDYPLSEFTGRQNSTDRAIGYAKVMMVFHMLRGLMETKSPSLFDEIIKETYVENQWKSMSWAQWQATIEQKFGQPLSWLFRQYVLEKGIPEITLHDMRFDKKKSGWSAKFDVYTEPKERMFSYLLPIRENFTDGSHKDVYVYIQNPKQVVNIRGDVEIASIQLDPGFDILRVPHSGELPVTMASFFGDNNGTLVIPSSGSHIEGFRSAAEGLKREGQQVVLDTDVTEEMKNGSLWIFGKDNKLWATFPQAKKQLTDEDSGAITLSVISNHPSNADASIVRTACTADSAPVAGTRKLSHYGKNSYLKFDGDKNIDKGVLAPTGENPMKWVAE